MKFSVDCLEGNGWDLEKAVANFDAVKVRILCHSIPAFISPAGPSLLCPLLVAVVTALLLVNDVVGTSAVSKAQAHLLLFPSAHRVPVV